MPTEYFADRARSTLAVDCTATATALTINTPAQEFPASYPYRLICGTEIMRVTARAGNVLTVTRAIEGTAAAAHALGAVVAHGVTAGALNDLAGRANLVGDQYGKPLDNAPATRGRMYYDEFTPSLYVDDGTVWEEVRPNPRTHTHSQSQIVGLLTTLAAKEASLGNPTIGGQVLASTTAGVRSWITPGTGGTVWYSGADVPASGLGANGDYYLRTATGDVYTKTSGAWGSPIENLTGATGSGVPVGGTTGQALIKASAANYDTTWGTVAGGGGATPYTKHTEILVTGLAPTDTITAADLGPDPVYAGHDFIYAEVTN